MVQDTGFTKRILETKISQCNLHSKFDKYKLKTPLAVIALKHQVDFISIMVPLGMVAKIILNIIFLCAFG